MIICDFKPFNKWFKSCFFLFWSQPTYFPDWEWLTALIPVCDGAPLTARSSSVLFLLCLCTRLFICALWSPAGKGLTSWLSMWCLTVSLSLSHWSWVMCGTWLYRFLIFAPLLTFRSPWKILEFYSYFVIVSYQKHRKEVALIISLILFQVSGIPSISSTRFQTRL